MVVFLYFLWWWDHLLALADRTFLRLVRAFVDATRRGTSGKAAHGKARPSILQQILGPPSYSFAPASASTTISPLSLCSPPCTFETVMIMPPIPRAVDMNQDPYWLVSAFAKASSRLEDVGESNYEIAVLFWRLRMTALVTCAVSVIPLLYCLVVVSWVKMTSPLLSLNCGMYSVVTWFVVYLGYKGAVLRSSNLLWAHCVSSIVVAISAAASVCFFFAPGVLLSHFIATVDFPKDENWWVAIVIFVTVLVLLFVLSILLLESANLYAAFLAFVLWKELTKPKGYSGCDSVQGCLEAGLQQGGTPIRLT